MRGSAVSHWGFLLAVAGLACCGCEPAPPAKTPTTAPATSKTSPGKETDHAKPAGSAEQKRIIILTNGNSPYWDAARAGMQDAEKELKLKDRGLRAVLEVNDGTPGGQLEKLQQFNSQSDIVGVGVSALDESNAAVADELRKLIKKGVKVVTIDSDVDRKSMRDCRFAFIGTDNSLGGKELGLCAKGLRPEGGAYVSFVGRLDAQNAKERIEGLKAGAGDKFQSLDSMADNVDLVKARENVRNAIRNHKDKLKILAGIWSYNAPAIADVVKEMGNRKNYTIVVFDAEPGAIDEMGAGNIDAMVVQNPHQMGLQGVRLLKALHENDQTTIKAMLPKQGESADGDIYDTGLKVVVPDAKSPLKKEMFGKSTEFLTLEAFREWLGQYGLKGS